MSGEPDPAGDFIDACIEDLDEARRLFAADPQVVYLTKLGSPILHWMIIEDFQIGAQRLLEEFGVDVDHVDSTGQTALHSACTIGRLGGARLLLDHGANPDAVLDELDTPLSVAISSGHLDVCFLLIERGAKLDYEIRGETIFDAMSNLSPSRRSALLAKLAEHGVTPEDTMKKLGLDEFLDSPAKAFGWQVNKPRRPRLP